MKKTISLAILTFAATAITISCGKEPAVEPDPIIEPDPIQPADSTLLNFEADIEYVYDDSDFLNPERGMYITNGYNWDEDTDECTSALTVEQMRKRVRDAQMTLTFSEFYIHGTFEREYSEKFLNVIRQDLENHRGAGLKTIIRFVYVYKGPAADPQPQNPTPEMTMKHVAQIKPILQEYADVIYVFQAGFIGACAEWCNIYPDFTKAQKSELIHALLDALPASRQIQMRTPSQKMQALGLNMRDTLTIDVAFNGSDRARVGGHNDCFLANSNDAGTYSDGGARKYWKQDTRYTIMGGETCLADPTYCNCNNGYKNLQDYHWSYLNSAYNVNALTLLDEDGCWPDIRKRLGYRLYLNKAAFDGTWAAGGLVNMQFSISNCGFSTIINPRDVEFVIEASDNKSDKSVIKMDTDPRYWFGGGTYYWGERINLPDNLKSGKKYNLYLNLPDPDKKLHDNPEFSIRLANKNTWDAEQGMNLVYTFTAE